MLIETDLLIALARAHDKHHKEAVALVKRYRGSLLLSPYTTIELDLIVKSGNIRVKDYSKFFFSLHKLIKFYEIKIVEPKFSHVSKAYELRALYNLSFFDSLHATVAVLEKVPLVSYDNVYRKVSEVKYIHPLDLLNSK